MLQMSPSGALSPYYYKGGFFHGIHYGSYFDDMDALINMMKQEEAFIMKSPKIRRIMIDLYETNLTSAMLSEFAEHILRMRERIFKLAVAGDKKTVKSVRKVLVKHHALDLDQMYFCADMEEGKTWLVSDGN
ncbi:hypothetical protein D3C81_1512420 [compost metagenome]